MEEFIEKMEEMRSSRGWDKSDTPSILAKSVVIEAAELLECFQFDEEKYDVEKVKSELADVLMYAICLCRDLGLDYKQIIVDKIEDVYRRYPSVK